MRQLYVGCGVLLFTIIGIGHGAETDDMKVTVVDRPSTEPKNNHYVGNREPLLPSPLIKLPIGAIRPEGWLRKQLQLQADGFHGHLDELSRFVKKEKNAWLSPEGKGDHGWEELPYWLKGFGDTGYVLGDLRLVKEARIWIDGAIKGQQADGWFGPGEGRTGVATDLKGREDLWPNMIMLFCLQSHHEYTGDKRVLDLMTRYFAYLSKVPEEKFLVGYWPKMRAGDLLYSVYWLYNRTGDKGLLDLAAKVHRHSAAWEKDVINWHNVNIAQGFREPGTYYLQSKEAKHLQATERNWLKVREMYGQVPGGMFGSDENCRPGFTGPRQAIETCGMVEEMLSDELLLQFTGDLKWADRCEDVAFNSLPAALTADLKALRYLTSPNLVLSDRRSKSPGVQNGGPMFHMDPHNHRCCQHNFGHGWPYYAQNLWQATPGNGLAAVLYSACQVTAKVGNGTEVTIDERTHYPFDEEVEFAISTKKPVRFPLYLRVPGWCEQPAAKVNGQAVAVKAGPLTWIRIERTWSEGDTVKLTLPMKVAVRVWKQNHNSVSVDRGPLTYSLKIGERYVREGGNDKWPAWEIHPTTPWNYGLVLDKDNPPRSFEVVKKRWPTSDMPFTHDGVPIELKATGRRIPEWQTDARGLVGNLQPSPVKSDQPAEAITLIPMGAARLRIAAFPAIGEGADAHTWTVPPRPLGKVSASHCFENDTVDALLDGLVPKNSNDHSIPRFTWWDHKGTKEWVQIEFEKPRKVSSVAVYWFDDTGRGQCRLPASWRLLYREGNDWKPVRKPGEYGIEKDRFNETTFEAVETTALRLEVQLRDGFSGGILEWQLK